MEIELENDLNEPMSTKTMRSGNVLPLQSDIEEF